jgi:hypothetical protein
MFVSHTAPGLSMGIHITADLIEASYERLRMTPPFNKWKLPHADDVEFHAVPIKGEASAEHYVLADLEKKTEHHVIRINPKRHSTLHMLDATLAHEICHMREYHTGSRRVGCHGAQFKRLADLVCKHHGFDRGQF